MMEKEQWQREDGPEQYIYEQPVRQSVGVIAAGILLLIAGLFLVMANLYADKKMDTVRNLMNDESSLEEAVINGAKTAAAQETSAPLQGKDSGQEAQPVQMAEPEAAQTKVPAQEEEKPGEETAGLADLEGQMSAYAAANCPGQENWSMGAVDLSTGESCYYNNGAMQAASLIKLFIMGTVYESYDQLVAVYGEDDIYSLLYNMITASDNDAANTLVTYVGGGDASAGRAQVNNFCAAHGYASTAMGRMLLAPADNGDNLTSVSDCSEFLRNVYIGGFPHSSEMLEMLKNQERRHKIPAGTPDSVATANKTGELADVENDAAIVFADKPYILCVMSENLMSAGDAQTNIVNFSSEIYSYFN